MGNRTGANLRPENQRNFQGNGSLPRLQDVPRGTCVKCLSNQHVSQECRVYSRAQICPTVCVVNGRPHGFHSSRDCAVKQNWNRQEENKGPGFNSFQNRNQKQNGISYLLPHVIFHKLASRLHFDEAFGNVGYLC